MTKISLRKTEHSLCIQTYSKAHGKSDNFYISLDKIRTLLNTGSDFKAKDIYSYCSVWMYNGVINISISWLDASGRSPKLLKGRIEEITIDETKFRDFFYSDKEQIKLLSLSDKKPTTKLHFKSEKNLRNVLKNKMLRKKFAKKIMNNFYLATVKEVTFYDDHYNDYSFEFIKHHPQISINGGLIFHMEDDICKGRYSTHT
jgi:hypothetical protein